MTDLNMNASTFLEVIFDGRTDDEFVLLTKPAGDGYVSTPFTDLQVSRWSRGQGSAMYFCVSTVKAPEPDEDGSLHWRRNRESLTAAYVVVLDDIGTKIEDVPPVEPSYKLESSAGNFQWGYLIEPTEDFAKYEAVVEFLGERGWTDKGAGGSYRVMRVPGSINTKPGRNRFVSRVTEWNPDRVWTLDELAKALGVDLSEIAKAARGKKRTESVGGAATAEGGIEDPLLKWLEDEKLVVKDDGTKFVEVICPWHEEHTTGGDTAGYSPLGRGDDEMWQQHRAFSCLHEHCKDRSVRDFRDWCIANGGPFVASYDPLPWYQAQYIYIESGRRWVDLEMRRTIYPILEFGEFDNRYKRKVEAFGYERPVTASTAMLASPHTRRAATDQYMPTENGDPYLKVFEGDNGREQYVYNTYLEPNWPETDEEPTVFLDHIDYLLPEGSEFDLFLGWLAWKVQNPHKRSFATLMVAEAAFGTGRSWLIKALEKALQGQVNKASFNQFIGKGTSAEQTYNDWAAECQFLVVEEAKDVTAEEFFKAYDTMKERVSNDPHRFWRNTKFGAARWDTMWFNALIFSNHGDALALPKNDRRVCVLTNPRKMETIDYYDRLHNSLDDEAAKIYWYLRKRDVSKFDHVYPPTTPGKERMVERTASPRDQLFEHIREYGPAEVVTQESLKKIIRVAAREINVDDLYGTHDQIAKVARVFFKSLDRLRDAPNGARYTVDGQQVEVRALRNEEKWRRVDDERDRDTIMAEVDGAFGGRVVEFPATKSK
jgi:hypothetical protein